MMHLHFVQLLRNKANRLHIQAAILACSMSYLTSLSAPPLRPSIHWFSPGHEGSNHWARFLPKDGIKPLTLLYFLCCSKMENAWGCATIYHLWKILKEHWQHNNVTIQIKGYSLKTQLDSCLWSRWEHALNTWLKTKRGSCEAQISFSIISSLTYTNKTQLLIGQSG